MSGPFMFARLQPSGVLASIVPHKSFESADEAKNAAPGFLAGRKGGGDIVLVEIKEVCKPSAAIRYELYGKGVMRQQP